MDREEADPASGLARAQKAEPVLFLLEVRCLCVVGFGRKWCCVGKGGGMR